MKNINIWDYKNKKIHFIGIGGISMSALAEFLKVKGFKVSGSDILDSYIVQDLRKKGIDIAIGHKASNIEGADLIVYSSAIITQGDNPEMAEAKKKGIITMDRAILMGKIMDGFPNAIAVAGTHGKTTTTSILSMIMLEANLDPTIFVGGKLDSIGGNYRIGNSNNFLVEACEFSGNFLHMNPYIGLILNIGEDHLDYFKDIDEIYEVFFDFSCLVSDAGYVIGSYDDELTRKLLDKSNKRTISFSILGEGDWNVGEIQYGDNGFPSFRASYRGQDMGWFDLAVPGKYNIYNALGAISVAWAFGIALEDIKDGLFAYKGTHRRFEKKGVFNGITIYDDYGHHPTEIKATLEAAQKLDHKRLISVFQPYTFSRTKLLFDDFTKAFDQADLVLITDIMGGREVDKGEIHSLELVEALNKRGIKCEYLAEFDDVVDYLSVNSKDGDMIITTGCGNIDVAADMLVDKFKDS